MSLKAGDYVRILSEKFRIKQKLGELHLVGKVGIIEKIPTGSRSFYDVGFEDSDRIFIEAELLHITEDEYKADLDYNKLCQ